MNTVPVRVDEYEMLLRIRADAIEDQRQAVQARQAFRAIVAEIDAEIADAQSMREYHERDTRNQRGLSYFKGALSSSNEIRRIVLKHALTAGIDLSHEEREAGE